ncbi:MAG: hypothetical protein IPJ55_17100 [Chloracidobacterium sp.]|nr:hypothetical protein [Chloracidobacterium sp.]
MTKQEIIANESKFQRACQLWVNGNIGECVSYLMHPIGQNLEECSRIFDFDYDEALGWFQKEDYSEVVDNFIDDADLDDLETIADMVGDWGDGIGDVPTASSVEDRRRTWVIPPGHRGDQATLIKAPSKPASPNSAPKSKPSSPTIPSMPRSASTSTLIQTTLKFMNTT